MIMFLEGGGGFIRSHLAERVGRDLSTVGRLFFSRFNLGVNTSMLVSQGMLKASVAEDTRNLT